MFKTVFKDPLFHFIVLGALLFPLYSLMQESEDEPLHKIVISNGDIQQLSSIFEKQWRRPPTAQELEGLVDARVEEEVMYREAMSMGLDQDDVIVRRRMKQKLDFILDGSIDLTQPSEDELARYFKRNESRYQESAVLSFRHWYFSVEDTTRPDPKADLAVLVDRLNNKAVDEAKLNEQADGIMLPPAYQNTKLESVKRDFGHAFADQLLKQPVGRWIGPMQSPFGYHIVYIDQLQPAQVPPLSQVKDAVLQDWNHHQQQLKKQESIEQLKGRYQIVIQMDANNEAS